MAWWHREANYVKETWCNVDANIKYIIIRYGAKKKQTDVSETTILGFKWAKHSLSNIGVRD